MPNHGKDLLALNSVKIAEAKASSLTSNAYKRGVLSALPCLCPFENCRRVICRPRELLTHIQNIHKERHMFWCTQCDTFFRRPGDFVRHRFYVHDVPEWSENLTTKVYTLTHNPVSFNAKTYFQKLSKAEKTATPYPKVAKKRRCPIISRNDGKKVALCGSTSGAPATPTHVVAKRSLPIPVDIQPDLGTPFEHATVEELLEGKRLEILLDVKIVN